MPKTRNFPIALASCLGLMLNAAPVFAADPGAKPAASDAAKTTGDAGGKTAAGSGGAAAKPAAKDPNAPAMPSNLSDSPYANGAPAVTGGYTDTSQGGTKGSGDPNAIPPGVHPGGSAPPAAK